MTTQENTIDNILADFREYLSSLLGKSVYTPDHNEGIPGFISAAFFQETDDEVGDIIIAVWYAGWEIDKPELWKTFRWPIQEAFTENSNYAKFITTLQVYDEYPEFQAIQKMVRERLGREDLTDPINIL